MSSTNRSLLATASLAALTLGAGQAMAQTHINGGGSTLAYPTYLSEFSDLYKVNTAFIFGNKNVTPEVTYYGSVGSGAGTTAFLTNAYASDNGGTTAPVAVFGSGTVIHYGASDSTITAAQVSAYNTSPGLGTVDGPLIQLPAFGVPITVPFNDGTATAVTLTDTDLCGIYSGKFTNWSQTSAHASVPANPITVIFRGDGSGTSFLFTQHLAAVCTAANSNVTFTATQYFGGLFSTLPSNFLPAQGSGGIQSSTLSIQAASSSNPVTLSSTYLTAKGATPIAISRTITAPSSAGYVGPDYTSIAPKAGNYNAKVLVASLVNAVDGKTYAPTTANVTTALATSAAPPSNKTAASDPTQWVPAVPKPSAGYPIVGFTNLLVSQCYQVANVTSGIKAFLQDQYNNTTTFATDISNNGFVQVPNLLSATYVTAIDNTFLNNTTGYNLNIGNSTICKNGTGGGKYVGR
jgi:ABC-type phosphate transport system substrate-binding protein